MIPGTKWPSVPLFPQCCAENHAYLDLHAHLAAAVKRLSARLKAFGTITRNPLVLAGVASLLLVSCAFECIRASCARFTERCQPCDALSNNKLMWNLAEISPQGRDPIFVLRGCSCGLL